MQTQGDTGNSLDWFFLDEGDYCAILGALLTADSALGQSFRQHFVALLPVAMQPDVDGRKLRVEREFTVGHRLNPPRPTQTIDLVVFPEGGQCIIAIEVKILASSARKDQIDQQYSLLRGETDLGHHNADRIHLLYLYPGHASVADVIADEKRGDQIAALNWADILSVMRTAVGEAKGESAEPLVAMATCAVRRYDEILVEKATRKFPVSSTRKDVRDAMKRARTTFQAFLANRPEFQRITWSGSSYMHEPADYMEGSMKVGGVKASGRGLAMAVQWPSGDGPIRAQVYVSIYKSLKETHRRQLAGALMSDASALDWAAEPNIEEAAVTHSLVINVEGDTPTVDGRPLHEVLVEGLQAYATAFRNFLTTNLEIR